MFDNIPYNPGQVHLSREDQFVLEVQYAARQLWLAVNKLSVLQTEWSYRDFTNTLAEEITLADAPTVADMSALIFTTTDAFKSLLAAGHGTNLTKVL